MEIKECTCCKQVKELKDFNKNKSKKDGLNNICRACSNERSKSYYNNNREKHIVDITRRKNVNVVENRKRVFDYLIQNACIDCGEADPIVLEFDHRDMADKFHDVSYLVGANYKWETILKEIHKCDIRCANCHRRKTAKQLGYYKNLMIIC